MDKGVGMIRSILLSAAFIASTGAALAAPVLNAATLPNSRAVAVNAPATIFASVINSGDDTANNCRVALGFGANAALSVSYSPADGAGNINGPVNTPVAINASAVQQFVIAVTASSAFTGDVPLTYVCDNGQAISATGLNDLALHATIGGGPDIITIASTLTGDGVMNTNANGRGIISISAINIGAGDPPPDGGPDQSLANEATITVRPQFTNFDNGAAHTLTICQSNASAVCQTGFASSVQATIGDAPVFFNVALQQLENIGVPFFPGEFRLRIEFRDGGGNLVGATSIAPRSTSPTIADQQPHGYWELFIRDDSDPAGSFTRVGRLFFPPDGSTPMGAIVRDNGQPYIQPMTLQGNIDTNNGTRFIGCMRMVDTAGNDSAFPGVNIRFVARHFLRGTYDSASSDSCPPPAVDGVSRPSINPVSSSGIMYGAYIDLASDDGMDPASIDWGIRNPLDENESYGSAQMNLDMGSYQVSGTYRGCDLSGLAAKYTVSSESFGNSLAFRLNYTTSNCPQGSPAWATGSFTGVFPIPDSQGNSVDGTQLIFTDGFESGDVSAWTATIP